MKNRPGLAPIIIILIIIAFVVIGGAAFYLLQKPTLHNIGCTQEAKGCPDGSYVGRTGPNCEFAQCPKKINTSATPEILQACGIDKQCPSGFVCDYSYVLPKGWDVSQAKIEGDQLCHKSCEINTDCENTKCIEKDTWTGDVSAKIRFCDTANTTTSTTTNWQTYRNEQYGFEIKYPISFKLQDENQNNYLFIRG